MSLIEEAESPAGACSLRLGEVKESLAELSSVDLLDLPGEAVLGVLDDLEIITRQVQALSARALAAVDADGRWAIDGARSLAAWYRGRSGRHHTNAAREVRQARALRDHLPGTAEALAAGHISTDHAAAMVRHTTDSKARRDKLRDPDVGEDFLLDHARRLDATAFTIALRHWGLRADPDAADRAYVADSDREEFYLAETTDGYVPGGWLSKASGTALLEALAARIGTPAATDTRTRGQRQANALTALAHLSLDSGVLRPGARIRPHVAVTVPFPTLERLVAASRPPHEDGCNFSAAGAVSVPSADGGRCDCRPSAVIGADLDAAAMVGAEPATLSDGTPLPPTLLARLTCSSHMHRVVFGPDSEVLDVGREERLFTAAQTRAIIARDGNCRYPGCNAPSGEGEIHHSIWWWAQNGNTDLDLGVLLCWYHHDFVHRKNIAIEHGAGNRWTFLRRDGTTLGHSG